MAAAEERNTDYQRYFPAVLFEYLCGSIIVRRSYALVGDGVAAEQQGNAPQCRQPYQSIYNAADGRGLAAEQPCHDIEAKQSDATPVESAARRLFCGDNRRSCKNFVYI